MAKDETPAISNADFLAAIEKMAAGTPEQREAREVKERQKKARRENWLKERAEFEKVARIKYQYCSDGSSHHKQHPYQNQHTIGGQLNGDNLVHPICIKCQSEFPPFKPEYLQGNDLREVQNLSVEMIEMWAKESGTDVSLYRFDKKPEAVTA
jgi:hypothetical protein